MSFYNGNRTEKTPGALNGNPLNGLSERVCVQVKKVFDACIKQLQEDNVELTLSDFTPAHPAQPLTFVSCRSTSPKGIISNLSVDRLDDKPRQARVRCSVAAPMELLYVDAKGVEGKAKTSVAVREDVVLYVPEPSVIPYQFEASANCVALSGIQTGENVFKAGVCKTVILKIIVEAELLIPSYGYAQIPQCQNFTQEVCSGFFELPIYPDSKKINGNNNNNSTQ